MIRSPLCSGLCTLHLAFCHLSLESRETDCVPYSHFAGEELRLREQMICPRWQSVSDRAGTWLESGWLLSPHLALPSTPLVALATLAIVCSMGQMSAHLHWKEGTRDFDLFSIDWPTVCIPQNH